MYWWARGCKKDHHEAMTWFQAAAHEGYALAQYQIGQIYQHGTDVFPQHLETARDYFQLAGQQVRSFAGSVWAFAPSLRSAAPWDPEYTSIGVHLRL